MRKKFFLIPIILLIILSLTACQSWDEYWKQEHQRQQQEQEKAETQKRELEEIQNQCDHDFVPVSKYHYVLEYTEVYSKCSKCGKELH